MEANTVEQLLEYNEHPARTALPITMKKIAGSEKTLQPDKIG